MRQKFGYKPALDGVRALAILGVLLDHSLLAEGGQAGVTVFFVLSGFLITSLLLIEREQSGTIALRSFYWRRAARLYPALLIAVPVGVALGLAAGADPAHVVGGAVGTLLYVMDLMIFASRATAPWLIFGWAWSLALEEQFYLLWPPLLRRLRLRPRWIVTGLLCVAVASSLARIALAPAHLEAVYASPFTRCDALLVGCALAFLPRVRRAELFGLLGVAALALIYAFGRPTPTWIGLGTVATIVAASGIVLGADSDRTLTARVLAWRPFVYIGQISYALYIWNSLLGALWAAAGHNFPHTAVDRTAWLALSLLLSHVSTFYVEQPIRDRVRRRHRPSAPHPEQVLAAA